MAAKQPFVSFADYAKSELTSDVRHEWHDGIVVAMSGGTLRHAALTARVIVALGNALRDCPCQVFSSDARIRIRPTRLGTYPDVSVVCGNLEVDCEDDSSLVNPILVVEVLSPSTEAYDRGAKFAHYRSLPSLKAVLLVRQEPKGMELFSKRDDGSWVLVEADAGDLRIDAIDVTLSVDDLYREPLPS